MVETSNNIGLCQKRRVLVEKGSRAVPTQKENNLEHVTLVFSIHAKGRYLGPLFSWKAKVLMLEEATTGASLIRQKYLELVVRALASCAIKEVIQNARRITGKYPPDPEIVLNSGKVSEFLTEKNGIGLRGCHQTRN